MRHSDARKGSAGYPSSRADSTVHAIGELVLVRSLLSPRSTVQVRADVLQVNLLERAEQSSGVSSCRKEVRQGALPAHAQGEAARRQLHLPTGDNYTSPSLRPAGT